MMMGMPKINMSLPLRAEVNRRKGTGESCPSGRPICAPGHIDVEET